MATNPTDETKQPFNGNHVEVQELGLNKSFEDETLLAKHQKRLGGAIVSIIVAAAVPVIIIFLITGLLIGLMVAHHVTIHSGWQELQAHHSHENKSSSILAQARSLKHLGGSGAYYVHFNPSSLTTIASSTGKVLPYLSSSIMALVAFFAADHILRASRSGRDEALLTPHQLTLLLGLLSSGTEHLYDTARYRFSARGRRLKKPVPDAFIALGAVTFLGFFIPVVDTWLGIATTPIQQVQVQKITPPNTSFGRGLSSSCTDPHSSQASGSYLPCNLDATPLGTGLLSPVEAYKTINDISDTHIVRQYSTSSSQICYFLGDVGSSTALDFKAQTFAVSSQCALITGKCGLPEQLYQSFNCTPSFVGRLAWSGAVSGQISGASNAADDTSNDNTVGIQFFRDAGLTKNFSSSDGSPSYSHQNPLFFGTWATEQSSASVVDPDVVIAPPFVGGPGAAGSSWVLNCSSTIYEATYDWVNGTVVSFNTTLANASIGGIFSAAFAAGYAGVSLENTAILAGFAKNGTQLASITANRISQAAVALSVAAFSPRTNILEQSRTVLNLTRVPKLPLYILLTLKFVYAVAVIVLAIAAIAFTRPSETQEVKARLSIKGLVAASFEPDAVKGQAVGSLEEMFAEHGPEGEKETKKVGIVKTDRGGWVYATTAVGVYKGVSGLVEAVVQGK